MSARWIQLLALGLVCGTASASAAEETHAYAVIVANNSSSDGSLAPLRYADDDGARYFELFSLIAPGRVSLHAVLDPETQRIFPQIAGISRVPSRQGLIDSLTAAFQGINSDRAAGIRTVLYFVYVGHGSVGSDGEGTMHLSDGRFTRSDLYQELIGQSPATMNHLIIDACNAYLMVARRGDGPEESRAIDDAVKSFLGRESLASYPNVGVLASTSQAAEVHEWGRFGAGIFSHEVRSALAGAADVDRDRAVSYDEVRAFLGAANGRVSDPRARLRAFAAPPAIHLGEPLFDQRLAQGAPSLEVPASLAGRYWLEDARGVRYLDFNSAKDGPVTLLLVPSGEYFLRTGEEEIRIPSGALALSDASRYPKKPVEIAFRGAETMAFQRDLFAIPFGRAYFDGFANAQPEVRVEAARPLEGGGLSAWRILALGVGTSGLASIATGIGFGVVAGQRASEYRASVGQSGGVESLKAESESLATTANILYAVGGGLIGGAVAAWLFGP